MEKVINIVKILIEITSFIITNIISFIMTILIILGYCYFLIAEKVKKEV